MPLITDFFIVTLYIKTIIKPGTYTERIKIVLKENKVNFYLKTTVLAVPKVIYFKRNNL